jgi:hypothetical protein
MNNLDNLSGTQYETIVIARPFRKLSWPIWVGPLIIGLLSYAVFLLLAGISGKFARILSSYMHFLQVIFSLEFIIGSICASVVNSRFNRAFNESKSYFDTSDNEYDRIIQEVAKMTNSPVGLLFSAPMMVCCIVYTFLVIAPRLPDTMFPVRASEPVFLFVMIFEFSLMCTFLLGNIGYWFTYCVAHALARLEKFPFMLPALPTRRLMSKVSGLIITSTVLLTLIIGLAFPGILNIVIHYSSSEASLWIGGGGLAFVLITAGVLFIVPQFRLHGILVEAKEAVVGNFSEEYAKNEARIMEKMDFIKRQGCSEERLQDMESLIKANAYLVERMLFLQSNAKEWAFDVTAVITIVTSSIIPIATFVFQLVSKFIGFP